MVSERIQRRLERLLDQIDEAEANGNWESVRDLALDVLEVDNGNTEANAYLRAAERRVGGATIIRRTPPSMTAELLRHPPLSPTAATR